MTVILTKLESVDQVVCKETCEKFPYNIKNLSANAVGNSITMRGSKEIYGVLRMLDCTYRYYNPVTRELSNTYDNLNQIDIESI